MPDPSTFKATDIIGLCVIMGGLCMYRFGERFWENMFGGGDGEDEDKDEGFVKKPLLSPFAEGGGAMEGGGMRGIAGAGRILPRSGGLGKAFNYYTQIAEIRHDQQWIVFHRIFRVWGGEGRGEGGRGGGL